MKCDNCGKEEVNFHYTSNVNGSISERHLCAECAGKLGLDEKLNFADKAEPEASFEEIFADLFGAKPTRRMFGGVGMMFPTFVIPAMGLFVPGAGAVGDMAQHEKEVEIKTEIDEDMRRRREINVMREQMRQAAEAEDFEKAAALRDTIKKMEVGESL